MVEKFSPVTNQTVEWLYPSKYSTLKLNVRILGNFFELLNKLHMERNSRLKILRFSDVGNVLLLHCYGEDQSSPYRNTEVMSTATNKCSVS